MDAGSLAISQLSGGFDLYNSLESGQTYTWSRSDGGMYTENPAAENAWYETIIDGCYVAVCRDDGQLQWRSSDGTVAPGLLRHHLRLDDDLEAIYSAFPDEPIINAAINRFSGMRLVRDPPFQCLISFICSAQMRVKRIYQMQQNLSSSFGTTMTADGRSIHAFPTPAQLAAATETELRELGIGYRAPYVQQTAEMVHDGVDPTAARNLPYEEARSYLTQYPGVGNKVADCVMLFSLGFLEAVPLDTWIQKAIATHFPACALDSYEETSQAIRSHFGPSVAGYVQTYVFHHLRTQE